MRTCRPAGGVLAILENREIRGVLDIGGDPVGARVLARFQPKIVLRITS